ncbi:cytoplasmic dynein 2 light intermediate chain 1 [Uranotaenia lowii]|uniref:cytoplasmic dynein 2 light intermediate chain 1 n=1 Tax=Uranotaenia lowii TaxID=190385 RepID=UPI002478FAB8|nr:cytoplasmic dynein 2 light intermediate chain 1 [Uranotaenia lowii]XP_055593087.1 cytoplasmic dynein 2 light intermediate chain 1 [Uranotaenia lowii]
MSELSSMEVTEPSETIQDIALKLVTEQMKQDASLSVEPNERTIFVLGSKGAGKSTLINRFLDRDDITRPTLALEYSFGRRTASGQGAQKNICNVWELGSLVNSNQLIEVPVRSHGITTFGVVVVLDLSQPERIWTDLECVLNGLKQAVTKNCSPDEIKRMKDHMKAKIGPDHVDISSLEILPFPVVIIGGKYDIFQNIDSEVKKHVCRCLRSIAHAVGAALIFYTSRNAALSKILRDVMNHLGFGSPSNPFKTNATDHNGPVVIPFGGDSWEKIGVTPTNSERIGLTYSAQIPQVGTEKVIVPDDPSKDAGFKERIIDELRAQKDEELMRLLKDTEIRMKFETVQ